MLRYNKVKKQDLQHDAYAVELALASQRMNALTKGTCMCVHPI